MTDFLIDGLPIPAPAGLRRTLLPLGSRDRTAGGDLALEQRGFKQRLLLTWADLSPEKEAALRAALTREPFFTLTVPGGFGQSAEETVCCLLSYETTIGPAPAGVPLLVESVRVEMLEK